METPKYLFSSRRLWADWTVTSCSLDGGALRVGPENEIIYTVKDHIDSFYPGFCAAFDMLHAKGCDEYFVTHVLKYCIIHAEGESLNDFLERTKVILAVETALALGMTGVEFVALRGIEADSASESVLPDDMLLISKG